MANSELPKAVLAAAETTFPAPTAKICAASLGNYLGIIFLMAGIAFPDKIVSELRLLPVSLLMKSSGSTKLIDITSEFYPREILIGL